HAELEPADDQLAERRRVDVALGEPADVGGPPRDAGQADVQPGRDLPAQVLEGGVDVAGPDQRAVALAARPGGPAQQHDLLLAFGLHALVEAAGAGVGRVVEAHRDPYRRAPVPGGQLQPEAVLIGDQVAQLAHLGVILAG